MPPTVLVTGASGFLGTALRRAASPVARVVPAGFRGVPSRAQDGWLRLDVRDEVAVREAFERLRPDAVLHAAATMRPSDLEAVIVGGTRAVARAASAIGAFLLHVSTDMVFDGEAPPYREDSPVAPNTEYGRAKALAEEIARRESDRCLVARTSLLFEPSLDDPRTRWMLERIAAGETVTLFTDEVRCPALAEDVAHALWRALADCLAGSVPPPAVAHLCGPRAMTRFAFGSALLRSLGQGLEQVRAGTIAASGLVRPKDLTLVAPATPAAWRAPIRSALKILEAPREATDSAAEAD